MRQKHKLVMVPTEKQGVILSEVGAYNTDMILISDLSEELRGHERPHNHLCVLSDEEIKPGDWCYHSEGYVRKVIEDGNSFFVDNLPNVKAGVVHKIIATTDLDINEPDTDEKDITYAQLPIVPESLVKEFVDKRGIDEVDLEYEFIPLVIQEYAEIEGGALPEPKMESIERLKLINNQILWSVPKESFTRADMIHALTYGHREGKIGRSHANTLIEYRETFL